MIFNLFGGSSISFETNLVKIIKKSFAVPVKVSVKVDFLTKEKEFWEKLFIE